VKASGLCAAHYMQQRRGRLGEAPKRAPNRQGGYVRFRLDEAHVATVQAIAERRGISLSDAYREAVLEWVERQTR
jgi:hypothetical protein